MRKLIPITLSLVAASLAGCVIAPKAPEWSTNDPTNPNASSASSAELRPTLIAGTKRYIDPSIGREAGEMKMGGGMQGMDHSKMPGMGQAPAAQQPAPGGDMQGMDHSKMGANAAPQGGQPAPGAQPPADKAAVVEEMKKTAEEMKKLSDELKAQSGAPEKPKSAEPPAEPGATPPLKPGTEHSQHPQ